ncbi:MAG: transcription elongation factor GreB [Halomonadaceae bacterium]|nr:MAG: transcription elongation factor GreB [Halomonadaceae bacterium]
MKTTTSSPGPSAPGRPRSSCYITPEGERTLQAELRYLWKVKRPEITRSVSEAAAQGDRSENAEYIYGKKQLREIDRRVRFLDKRLEALTVVHDLPRDQHKVFFGAWVTLQKEPEDNPEGETVEYRLVGPDEADISRGTLSIDAPLARSLLHREVDDEVRVTTPEGILTWRVTGIRYQPA